MMFSNNDIDKMYQISLISPDLRREEMMQQICDSLDQVERISRHVTSQLELRMTEIRQKVEHMDNRAKVVQQKVEQLKTTKHRATVVFSPAKYPAELSESSFGQLRRIFRPIEIVAYNRPFDPNQKRSYSLKSKIAPFDHQKTIGDKQLYYNVRVTSSKKQTALRGRHDGEGLGDVTDNISSVSDLLIFGTPHNPYKKHVSYEWIEGKKRTRATPINIDQSTGIAAAPKTLTQIDYAGDPTDAYAYTPGMGEVPKFDVPDLLPDLPGVADLSFNVGGEELPSIAPSLPYMAALPEVIPDVMLPPEDEAPLPYPRHLPPQAVPGPTAKPLPPPPPPPPPPLPPSATTAMPQTDRKVGPGAPPPPPPPPPAGVQAVPAVAAPAERSGLMDAIRNAGGSNKFKFRSKAEKRKQERKEQKQKEREQQTTEATGASASGEGDLMSDLAKALALRRKAISGRPATDERSKSTPKSPSLGGAFDRISDMIPPPPLSAGEKSDNDSEWED